MKLFILGLGYSALYFARTRRAAFSRIGGAVRGEDKALALRAEGIGALRFDDPRVADEIEDANVLLMSIPPQDGGDPALARFGAPLVQSRAKTLIYLSTIGVYGDHGGAWIDEDAALRPSSARNAARAGAERGWLALGTAQRQAHVLRLAGLYGPGQNQLVKLREGRAQRIVKPGQVFNRIHVEDIARAVEAAARAPRGGVWNVADDEPAPPQDVLVFAAGLIGVPPPPPIDFATAELSAMARGFYGDNKRVSNARLKNGLGVKLAFPTYREGLRALAQAEPVTPPA